MNTKNKYIPYVVFGVPILIGLYFVYRAIKKGAKGKDSTIDNGYSPNTNTEVVVTQSGGQTVATPKITQYFPLKKGSRGALVKDLQNALLSLGRKEVGTPDGVFGSNTEKGLKAETGKTSVDSQSELDTLITKSGNIKAQTESYKKNGGLSDKLINIFSNAVNQGKKPYFKVITKNTQSGLWNVTTDGRKIYQGTRNLTNGTFIPNFGEGFFNNRETYGYDTNLYGFIILKYVNTDNKKVEVSLNPNDVEVINT
jgi:hypothetical protein